MSNKDDKFLQQWLNHYDIEDEAGMDVSRSQALSQADNVVSAVMDAPRQLAQMTPQETIRDRAIRQMEHANLYRILLENSIFEEGSARPEVLQIVETEIRDFIEERLISLLNLGDSKPKAKVESEFSDEEKQALKILSAKVIEKFPKEQEKKKEEIPTPKLKSMKSKSEVSAGLKKVEAQIKEATKRVPVVAPTAQQTSQPASAAPVPSGDPNKPADYSKSVKRKSKKRALTLKEKQLMYSRQQASMQSDPAINAITKNASSKTHEE